MTTTTPRRAFLAGVATLAAGTAANVAAIAVTRASVPDPAGIAEDPKLLALGEELEGIIREWLAKQAIDRARSKALRVAAERAGIRHGPYEELSKSEDKRWSKFIHDYCAEHADAVDEHGCSVIWNSIHDRMFPLCRRIMA